MCPALQDLSREEWHLAIDRHLAGAFSASLCFAPEADWYEDADFSRFVSGLPDPFGNVVWNARIGDESCEEQIRQALAPLLARNLPAIWIVGPHTRPANLPDLLVQYGFDPHSMPAMAIDLAGLPALAIPPGTQILEVCDDSAMEEWMDVLGAGYGISREVSACFGYWPAHLGFSAQSPLRAFLAHQNGRPVASSLLYLDGGVAGIYCVATLPEARRQGIATALTVLPLMEARDLGYRTGVLQASPMGESVYRRIGFQEYGAITMCIRPGLLADGSA